MYSKVFVNYVSLLCKPSPNDVLRLEGWSGLPLFRYSISDFTMAIYLQVISLRNHAVIKLLSFSISIHPKLWFSPGYNKMRLGERNPQQSRIKNVVMTHSGFNFSQYLEMKCIPRYESIYYFLLVINFSSNAHKIYSFKV